MNQRHSDARAIQSGACNPRGIARAFIRHADDMANSGADTDAIRSDPALRLIVHQLAFLMDINSIERSQSTYAQLTDAVAGES